LTSSLTSESAVVAGSDTFHDACVACDGVSNSGIDESSASSLSCATRNSEDCCNIWSSLTPIAHAAGSCLTDFRLQGEEWQSGISERCGEFMFPIACNVSLPYYCCTWPVAMLLESSSSTFMCYVIWFVCAWSCACTSRHSLAGLRVIVGSHC
jgi:hypothetical protein